MKKHATPDFWLFTIAVMLLAIGIIMVYDSSYAVAGQAKFTGGDEAFFVKRQAIFAVVGVALMCLVSLIPYWKLRGWSTVFLLLSIAGLSLVFVPGLGVEVNGAKRWIYVGGLQIQPSEFAKLGLVMFLAMVLSAKNLNVRSLKTLLLFAGIPVAVVAVLIVKEDMGTAIILVGTAVMLVYMAGARISHLVGTLMVTAPMGLFFLMMEPYRLKRLEAFIDPFKDYSGSGYQVCQSLIALGSGGIFGVGICESRQKLFYLPARHTDFIYAIYGQETGLIGTVVLALLFLMFALRGLYIASRTKDSFGRLLAAGLSILIGGQALLNMLVVTSSVPATGVPLPFISYGGSSLALNLLIVGVLLGVSRYPNPPGSEKYANSTRRRRYRRTRLSRA